MAVVAALGGAAGTATSVFAGAGKAGEAGSSLRAWGFGVNGELGNGKLENQPLPVAVKGIACATSAAASYEDSFAVLADGSVEGWGEDSAVDGGGLGDNLAHSEHSTEPIEVPGISGAVQVAADIPNVFVVLANGTVEGWGDGHDGELGLGLSELSSSAVPVSGIGGFKAGEVHAMATADATQLALLSSGKVDSWGFNEDGQLGDGESGSATATPASVKDAAGSEPLNGIKAIAAGTEYSLALTETGEVMAWGGNANIGLGAGNVKFQSTLPVTVEDTAHDGKPLTEVQAIAAGGNFALALLKNGTVVAWGRDDLGQLGNGEEESSGPLFHPVAVKGLEHIIAIAAGELDGYALDETGRVYSWGANQTGELGTGASPETRDVPAQVSELGTGNTALAPGADAQHQLALGPTSTECGSSEKSNTESTASNPGGPGTSSTGSTPTGSTATSPTSSTPTSSTSSTPTSSTSTTPHATADLYQPNFAAAAASLILGCTGRQLTLTDVVQQHGHVLLDGAAASSLAGHKVEILFDGHQLAATATVAANGLFSASAPLPPAKLRGGNSARYLAESGSLKSLDLKLTRRLILDPPRSSGGKVSLTGEVQPPLAKPPAQILVEQQLSCGATKTVARVVPSADGHFALSIPAPAGAPAAIYRLSTKVRGNTASSRLFGTFSLPEPVDLAS
jgi:alpha-tubulin suppressor-like RCC1 family protein